MTQCPDEDRDSLTLEVSRPALVSRYFLRFNKVDIIDQLRQHELGLEVKWVGKGNKAGSFAYCPRYYALRPSTRCSKLSAQAKGAD